jgi:hypothetical protein
MNDFEKLLTDLLLSSERLHTEQSLRPKRNAKKQWRFSVSDFYDRWFRERGQAYYFLFRKNLKVTNIQFAELLSLIRAHNISKETGEPIYDLQFLSVSGFYEAIEEIVNSFPRNDDDPRHRYELISRMYYSLLSRHVVIDTFYGSCAVYIPPNLEIDLALICAHSGYIHSCGINIFTRKIDKAKKKEFFFALNRHLNKKGENSQPSFFIVYAHEDFTKNERVEKKEYLRDGLDDVKIYIEKFYMEAERLIDIVEEMRTRFKDQLLFHPAHKTPSQAIREAIQQKESFDRNCSIWLLVDQSVGAGLRQRGDDRFYICYEQHYINENPFQLFDENKPAWFSHTTIPHTLLSAMINVTGSSRGRERNLVLADPFAGTGTTWLETIKLDRVEAKCTDKTPIAPLLASDNLDFFCAPVDKLLYWQEQLESLIKYLVNPSIPQFPSASYDVLKSYNWALKFYGKLVGKKRDYIAGLEQLEQSDKADELSNASFISRLFFYLTLRTVGRNIAALKRGSQEWDVAYAAQALQLKNQIGLLREIRSAEQSLVDKRGKFTIYNGLYSLSCTVATSELIDFNERIKSQNKYGADGQTASDLAVGIYDVRHEQNTMASSLKPGSCDVVITDPPYGFNTDDDLEELAKLYADVIQKMISALKRDGQLILCLLDRSHTGRRSPYFTHKELITQQVLTLAERATPKREVIIPAYAVPERQELFRPPYYWESERALRRAILHFRIRAAEEENPRESQ